MFSLKNSTAFLIKKVSLILLISISALSIGCKAEEVIIPSLKEIAVVKDKYKGNKLFIGHISITIPEEWNYLFVKDRKVLISFVNNDITIRGEVLVYKDNTKKPLRQVFESYLKEKPGVKFLWISTIKGLASEIWFSKGSYVIKGIKGKRFDEIYNVYFALYRFGDKIYKLTILAGDNSKAFEQRIIGIINSLNFNKSFSKISYKRFGISITPPDSWSHRSTSNNQLVFISHISEPVVLSISIIKKLDSAKNTSLVIKKEINLFRINLMNIGYKYKFKISGDRLANGKRVIVFSSVGIREKAPLGIKKYYFVNKGYLYDIEVCYNEKNWDDGIDKAVDEVFKSMKFI